MRRARLPPADVPSSPTNAPTDDVSERALRRFVRARGSQDGDAMTAAWEQFVLAELPRIRGLVATFRNAALPGGRIPTNDHDVVVTNVFLRLRDQLQLEGESIGEARACVRHAVSWACLDYVRQHVREDRRRGGSIDAHGERDAASRGPTRTVEPATAAELVPDQALGADVTAALASVDGNKREVVVLSLAGYDADEIATRLGLTRANVYQLRRRGYAQLGAALKGLS